MTLKKIYNKFRRELYKPISRLGLHQASGNYFGLKIKIPILNGVGAEFLVAKDPWMSHCLSQFLKLKQGWILDIGVNTGLYLIKLRVLDSKREYLGFEPNPIGNHYTQELIRLNGFQNARILPFALSDTKQIRQFFVAGKADKMGSFYEATRYGDNRRYSFDVMTYPGNELVDIVAPEAICAIKIDVEGAELDVFRGLTKTISHYRPYIYCEIWGLPKPGHPTFQEKLVKLEALLDILQSINYQILGTPQENGQALSVLDSIDDFKGVRSKDYILTHSSEVENLISALGPFNNH